MNRRLLLHTLTCILSWLILVSLAIAQSDRGTITGTILDPSGAVVPEANVTAVNAGSGSRTAVTSTSAGVYSIPQLQAGTYKITVEKQGFKTSVEASVPLLVGQTIRVDFSMQLGQATETVDVQAEAPLLKVETTELGAALTNKDITDLPLAMQNEARSPMSFIALVPGVTGAQSGGGNGNNTTGKTFATSINGGQTFAHEVQIDGATIQMTNVSGDFRNITFPQEAVGEFKVETNNFSAEYGRTAGGIVSFTTRSGTNDLHGSVFEFLRNDALDARTFFNRTNDGTAATRPVHRQNEFGGTIGGPVRLPGYDGRNKTHFFFYYDGFRYRAGSTATPATVPTVAQRNGDFRDILGPQIGVDAQNRPIFTRGIYKPSANVNRDPFLGCDPTNNPQPNVICQDPNSAEYMPFSTVAENVLSYVPEPLFNATTSNFLSTFQTATWNTDRWGMKIDHAINDSHRINSWFSWARDKGVLPWSVSPFAQPISTDWYEFKPDRFFRLNYDWIIRPNLIHHFGFGFNRNNTNFTHLEDVQNPGTNWPQQLGLTGTEEVQGFPQFAVAGYDTWGTGGGYNQNIENGFVVVDNLTWTKGRHTIKFGIDFRRNQENERFTGQGNGSFNFGTLETGLPGQAATGSGLASFLLGQVNSATVLINNNVLGWRYQYYSGFAQDSFKVTPKLTLTYGLRYEVPMPRAEVYDRLTNFDPTLANPAAGGIPGALAYAGSVAGGTGKRRFQDADKNEWGPRFGIAYQLNDKTVLRGGYGLYYTPGGSVLDNGERIFEAIGYFAYFTRSSTDNGLTPAFNLDNGYPPVGQRPPIIDPSYINGSTAYWMAPGTQRAPYVQNWNLTVQRRLGSNTVIEAAYAGAKGTRLGSNLTIPNQVDPTWLSLGAELNSPITCLGDNSCPNAIAAGVTSPFAGFSGSIAQALRPFPQYVNIRDNFENAGASKYHALQMKFERRFSDDFNFLMAYTLSKTLDNSGSAFGNTFSAAAQDSFNRQAEMSISDNDVPHTLVMSYTYQLPFGPGKRYASKGGVVGKIIGDWQVSGIHSYVSGAILQGVMTRNTLPIHVPGAGQRVRANVTGAPIRSSVSPGDFDPETDQWLNPAAFSNPAPFTLGSGPRTYPGARGFAYLNEDISIQKRIPFGEDKNVEFRAEFFNPFNRVVFGGIPGDINAVNFGQVTGQFNTQRQVQFALKVNF